MLNPSLRVNIRPDGSASRHVGSDRCEQAVLKPPVMTFFVQSASIYPSRVQSLVVEDVSFRLNRHDIDVVVCLTDALQLLNDEASPLENAPELEIGLRARHRVDNPLNSR